MENLIHTAMQNVNLCAIMPSLVVCCFGMLHHVPKWQQAVVECARVLRPGGQFVMLDTSRRTFRWIGFLFPPEATFTLSETVDAATAAGLKDLETVDAGGWFVYLAGIT